MENLSELERIKLILYEKHDSLINDCSLIL